MLMAQPVTMTCAAPALSSPRMILRFFVSASPVTVQVLTMATSADSAAHCVHPASMRAAAMVSDSARLTLQPSV